jgi:nucleoside-diphosphate-sugar epimerase
MIAENVLSSYKDFFKIFIIRPATVCGPSNRIRLDVSVNQLVYQAIKNKKIILHGGQQIRPNIHIIDLVNAIIFFLTKKVPVGIYNLGFENLKLIDLAKMIKDKINCNIKIEKIHDIRSYRLDSSKIVRNGFIRKYFVKDAIDELIKIFSSSKFKAKDNNFNILKLKKILSIKKNSNRIWSKKFFKK